MENYAVIKTTDKGQELTYIHSSAEFHLVLINGVAKPLLSGNNLQKSIDAINQDSREFNLNYQTVSGSIRRTGFYNKRMITGDSIDIQFFSIQLDDVVIRTDVTSSHLQKTQQ